MRSAGKGRFHGKPCRRCGSTERYVCNRACVTCNLLRAYLYDAVTRVPDYREHMQRAHTAWVAMARTVLKTRSTRDVAAMAGVNRTDLFDKLKRVPRTFYLNREYAIDKLRQFGKSTPLGFVVSDFRPPRRRAA